jgi:hypothetical protein
MGQEHKLYAGFAGLEDAYETAVSAQACQGGAG